MIQDILPRYQEVANGSKTAFTFPFDVLRNEFIEVYVGSDKVTSGWTLSASEKTITFGVAPVAGALITIYRNIPVEWLNSVGTASSASIDEAVTYLVAQIQTIKEGLSRAIQTRVIDADKGEDLSDDYINSLGQATALYGECETLLAQIQVEGNAINALYEEFVERINNFVSTDPDLLSVRTYYYAMLTPNNEAIFYVLVDTSDIQTGDTVNLPFYVCNASGELNLYGTDNFTYDGEYFVLSGTNRYYLPSVSYSLDGEQFGGNESEIITVPLPTRGSLAKMKRGPQYDGSRLTDPSDEVVPSQKAVKTYVDTNTVNVSTDQTVRGSKDFKDILKVNEVIRETRTDLTKGTYPSDNYYYGLIYDDGTPYPSGTTYNNNNRFGLFETVVKTNGDVSTYMCAYKNVANAATNTQMSITYPATGDPYANCPTPTDTTSTSSTQMDTVGARNTQMQAYVKSILSSLYPVGSLYITTNNSATCPLASLISGSSWSLVAADKALWTSNRNGNTTINAGLPNIYGTFGSGCMMNWQDSYASGAFFRATLSQNPQNAGGTDGGSNVGIGFQASRSNSIYGNSSTVQPPAYRVNVWRRTA